MFTLNPNIYTCLRFTRKLAWLRSKVKHTNFTCLEAPTVVRMVKRAQLQHYKDKGYGRSICFQQFRETNGIRIKSILHGIIQVGK